MSVISPNIDAYGSHERQSALADILELQALNGRSFTVAELADYIKDNGWARKLDDKINIVGEEEEFEDLGEEVDASETNALTVIETIEERWDILRDNYPFEFREGRLTVKDSARLESTYLLLLAVTSIHAYNVVESAIDPTRIFEEIVSQVLASRGFLSANLGRERREVGSLEAALMRVGDLCKLSAVWSSGVVREHAQDEGVDVVAHLDWIDSRPMHWVYVIQATCGKSDSWRRKLMEPAPMRWKGLLGLLVCPRAVLAVPHHVSQKHAMYLAEHGSYERLVMDRLRLSFVDTLGLDGTAQLVSFLQAIEVDT